MVKLRDHSCALVCVKGLMDVTTPMTLKSPIPDSIFLIGINLSPPCAVIPAFMASGPRLRARSLAGGGEAITATGVVLLDNDELICAESGLVRSLEGT